jgi:hypothetical protein
VKQQLPPYPQLPTLDQALAFIESTKQPEQEPSAWISLPVRETRALPFEQFLGEIHEDGNERLVNMTLAQNGSAVFFYEIRRQEGKNIPVGPIYRVEMADMLRAGAAMVIQRGMAKR